MLKDIDFSGQTVLITGGSRGIGAQVAQDFAKCGANVVIAGRSKVSAEEMADQISKAGGKAIAVPCEMAKLENIDMLFETIKKEFGRLDVSIHNAGVNFTRPAIEVTEQDFDYIYDVNVKGLYFCCTNAAKMMIPQQKGKIINMASVYGAKPMKRVIPYISSKAAVIHMTRGLASEWARYNINVNAIGPGLIATDINEEERRNEKWLNKVLKTIPLRKFGEPSDISSLSLFLASDLSNYVTGQTLFADGGMMTE
ncbi:3-oxoacyl-ACP reductase FabG [Peribacillus frigoritolerans]|uniref:SDR family NAD(P)-dependent oxidoreductase n=1 Tax=Peribacillus frigoritolerans TaxID=450367 RepID=UPI0021D05B8C|nr:3-oxoacyl-ACP reductase family protein [Peribacillus frigoritolerans]MCU6598948.1 3-oxoacyl-ACP reductase FabG [Peribacillus frigoritolerans]